MRGQILDYDILNATGVIAGENGERYRFTGAEWRASVGQPKRGSRVDFETNDNSATEIYLLPSSNALIENIGQGEKSPIVAGLLALFLGSLGIHKFYLGYSREGAILLIGTLVSWMLFVVVIGVIGLLVIGVVCLAEAIIYITKTPSEFQQIYVDGKKPWF